MDKFGKQVADDIDWSNARVICIAADFTKYDEHAVAQINRNINLIRYKLFNPDLLMFELVNAATETHKPQPVAIENQVPKQKKNAQRYRLDKSSLNWLRFIRISVILLIAWVMRFSAKSYCFILRFRR